MGTWINKLSDPRILAIILSIIIIIVGLVYYLNHNKKNTEGFALITQERQDYEERSKRLYNDYSDMIPINKPTIIPRGESGDPLLKNLLNSPRYEGSADAQTGSALNYNYKFPYLSPPDNSELMAKIAKCEAVTDWNCAAFNDPDFAKYCGLCTKDGENHLGKKHIGGLYVDPYFKDKATKDAESAGTPPKYSPTAGSCKGEFLIGRPYCDVQKDRFECSTVMDFKTPESMKCAMCLNSEDGKFVYIGSRGGIESNYALTGKPKEFNTRLRFAVTHPEEATVTVTANQYQDEGFFLRKQANGNYQLFDVPMAGSFIQGTNVYICDIQNVKENDEIKINIRYPEYKDYNFTNTELSTIDKMVNPQKAPLLKAIYGPIDTDRFQDGNGIVTNGPEYMRDDPRARDVTQYVKSNYNINACTTEGIVVDSSRLGGDPTVGIRKALRLVFGTDPNNTIQRYCVENDTNPPYLSKNWQSMCPDPQTRADVERQVCETAPDGTPITNRTYTNGNNKTYYGTSANAKCVEQINKKPRGLVGIWESLGRVKRTVPLAKSVNRINGFDVGTLGVPLHGTVKSSNIFKSIAPESKVLGIPSNLFWFWSKDINTQSCQFTVVVPATLTDPSSVDDIKLCPSGPLVSTAEGAKRLSAGPCEAQLNGQPQGPGNFSMPCIQSMFLNSGCTKEGKAYPNTPEKLKALTKDPNTGVNNDIDAIDTMIDEMYTIATTTKNSAGLEVSDETLSDISIKCLGKAVSNPCDTPYKATGPHSASCLNYLYKNAGKDNDKIGQTYNSNMNRTSGTNRTDKTPILYCQTSGAMAPIGSDGKTNIDAINTANSYGSVDEVRAFYRKIHSDANFSKDPNQQRTALAQCYGVGISTKKPACKGTNARYVRVLPTKLVNDNCIQISQLSVYDVYDNNVSVNKPVKSTPSFQVAYNTNPVDGVEENRPFTGLYHSMCEASNYWEVDLKKSTEIAYLVYYNRADQAQYRSNGMRVQLLDENRIVVKEKLLTGQMVETVMFSNAKPAGILKANIPITLNPHSSPGSSISIDAGGETLIKPRSSAESKNNVFITIKGSTPGTFMFKDKFSERYLRVQGFRVRASENDNSNTFKKETTFKVGDSLAAAPNEISIESLSRPGSYLAVADNKGVYISPATTYKQQQACSWLIGTQ